MVSKQLGRIIAAREFTAKSGKRSKRILVQIGTPYQVKTGDWACPFRVTGAGPQKQKRVFGIDAFQALQLVYQGIRKELEEKKQTVTWEGVSLAAVLPRLIPHFGDEAFSARINRMIDRELRRYVKAAKRRVAREAKKSRRKVPA
jgi:hypothetical protein